jgi:hypothetical protein
MIDCENWTRRIEARHPSPSEAIIDSQSVNFAPSRLECCDQELAGLPAPAIPILRARIFQHLAPAILIEIEQKTPTAP